MAKKQSRRSMQWRTMDLHLHTPASVDYQEPGVTYLDILKRAEARGIDIIAFTDHNTISGYRQMMESVEQLEFLETSNRMTPEEQDQLKEYRRLFKKILVLLDGSELARRALDPALKVVKQASLDRQLPLIRSRGNL